MKGLTLSTNTASGQLIATVDPLLVDDIYQPQEIETFIQSTEYSNYFIIINGLAALCEKVNAAKNADSLEEQTELIGEIRDADIKVEIADNQLSAELIILSPFAGTTPSRDELFEILNQQGVVRGVSKKRIDSLLLDVSTAPSGCEFKNVIAKGLPAKDGKPSAVKPLFPNALERILQPQDAGDNKVDMRNLGDILCVQANAIVARRHPPTIGRIGFTVSGKPLLPKEGEWRNIKLGVNTAINPSNENEIIATVTGQPKFTKGTMAVIDTFESKGVNVGTGNIHYEGAVIVNGDVTESMQIVAKGDVTINGFVESATIESGGDIIITEGAMGKMNEEDCKLIARGSVFVQHGQGLDIVTKKNLNVRKQLAYSRVKCAGTVTIGEQDNPMGSLFASSLQIGSTLYAGTVGAVSGSALNIDFTESVNQLNTRYDSVLASLKQLRENNFDHEVKIRELKSKHIPSSLMNELDKVQTIMESEKHLLNWLEGVEDDLRDAKENFDNNAKLVVFKQLFPGVSLKMNNRNWRSEKEYLKSVVSLTGGKWQYNPLVK